ncbi:hypothetical protein [Psittacid alphaherpesvirus 5]|uniref:Uncharacterized protein n=1 Tax=Psittacid alphaherpesvirus 5 TaxID=2972693 RepID=A0A5P9JSW7_9ALPH|nr:hypothetical protein QKU09_gp76 [Psittacid alphaherpesvirus 5]QFU14620.1 hypothetical protein [Psittacid alphaherpesvirus 5]UOO01091.1 hypothetical protein [Psittacid alphaherpesvirus 5]
MMHTVQVLCAVGSRKPGYELIIALAALIITWSAIYIEATSPYFDVLSAGLKKFNTSVLPSHQEVRHIRFINCSSATLPAPHLALKDGRTSIDVKWTVNVQRGSKPCSLSLLEQSWYDCPIYSGELDKSKCRTVGPLSTTDAIPPSGYLTNNGSLHLLAALPNAIYVGWLTNKEQSAVVLYELSDVFGCLNDSLPANMVSRSSECRNVSFEFPIAWWSDCVLSIEAGQNSVPTPEPWPAECYDDFKSSIYPTASYFRVNSTEGPTSDVNHVSFTTERTPETTRANRDNTAGGLNETTMRNRTRINDLDDWIPFPHPPDIPFVLTGVIIAALVFLALGAIIFSVVYKKLSRRPRRSEYALTSTSIENDAARKLSLSPKNPE